MGRSHSKAHFRVTKVVPLENKGADTPSPGPVDFTFNQNLEEKSSYSLARLQDWNETLNGQLPPLRETWYGRYSTGKCKTQHEIYVSGPNRAVDTLTCLCDLRKSLIY